jgi:hypothetical protein
MRGAQITLQKKELKSRRLEHPFDPYLQAVRDRRPGGAAPANANSFLQESGEAVVKSLYSGLVEDAQERAISLVLRRARLAGRSSEI